MIDPRLRIGRAGIGVTVTLPVKLVARIIGYGFGHGVGEKGGDVHQAIFPVRRVVRSNIKYVLVIPRDGLAGSATQTLTRDLTRPRRVGKSKLEVPF